MKIILLTIVFAFSANFIYSQQEQKKQFTFQDQTIEYTKVDYSGFGLVNFDIIAYSDTKENAKMEKKVVRCLKKEPRLYHTYYFILKIPENFQKEADKNKVLVEFLNHISEEEQEEKMDIYLHLGFRFSFPEGSSSTILTIENIKEINKEITPRNICRKIF